MRCVNIIGQPDSKYYYIVTDTTDLTTSQALGLNHASKLSFAELVQQDPATGEFVSNAVRSAYYDEEGVLWSEGGTVDFSPATLYKTMLTDTSV